VDWFYEPPYSEEELREMEAQGIAPYPGGFPWTLRRLPDPDADASTEEATDDQ
jgi:hypothetical protein